MIVQTGNIILPMVLPDDMFLPITDPFRGADKHCELNSYNYNRHGLYLIENDVFSALLHHPTLMTVKFSNN